MNLDRIIARLPSTPAGDLTLCVEHGVAYQTNRAAVAAYDAAYYDKCRGYEGGEIAQAINAARIDLVARHYGPGLVVDVGIGSGEFIKLRPGTHGFDVNPVAAEWLKREGLWAPRIDCFGAATFWDVLEHVPDPCVYLDQLPLHGFVFASIPTFDDITRVRESKHYRPGEHLQYFTVAGFTEWMRAHGFALLEYNRDETDAGRESIGSFAFKRFACPPK